MKCEMTSTYPSKLVELGFLLFATGRGVIAHVLLASIPDVLFGGVSCRWAALPSFIKLSSVSDHLDCLLIFMIM